MRAGRIAALAMGTMVAGACAPGGPPPQASPTPAAEDMPSMAAGTVCDPEDFAARPKADRDRINAHFSAEEYMSEIRVIMHAPAARVRDRVTAAMLACKMPLSQSGDGVISADYGQQMGLIGQYAIVAHAAVVALNDTTTLVRLFGQETSKRGSALAPRENTSSISNKDMGRALSVWITLRNVAKQLRADPELRVDVGASTDINVVYAR